MDALLAGLNAPQQAVAVRDPGPLLAVAGPGAGKTRAIVARVAHLLVARAVPAGQITAITFSRRAAGELQSRLEGVTGSFLEGGSRVWSGTFHALGARILRHGGARLFGRPAHFTVYDQDDTERTLRRILGGFGVPQPAMSRLTVEARQAISLAKRRAESPTGTLGDGDVALPLADLFAQYERELHEASAFDFDDLVTVTVRALSRDAALLGWAQQQTRHLVVDEYQDTDPVQEALLRRLASPPYDVCVVADPQQSIYAFRGAAPEQVHRFLRRWPNAAVIRLEQNYRSTKSIVAVARRLIAPWSSGVASLPAGNAPAAGDESASRRAVLGLRLWTDNPPGLPARLWVAPHPEKEAEAIARDVAVRLEEGWPPEEIAILVRTHAQARPIEAALIRAQVPHALVGGVRFFAREEIKDLLAYLRLAALTEDAAAFWRIVNTPRRGLGPAAMMSIARYSMGGGGPVAASRRWAATEMAPDGLYDLLAHIDELTALERSGASTRAVLSAAITLVAYRDYVRRQHPQDASSRLEAIEQLLSLASGYTESRQFLDEATLSGEDETPVALSGRVRLSTVHAAKGLEFRAVYVPGCELGLFPLLSNRAGAEAVGAAAGVEPTDEASGSTSNAEADANDGDPGPTQSRSSPMATADPEERRVFYVAVTRAKESLTLSYCTFRRDSRTQPSPYLTEIGRGLLRRAELGGNSPPKPAKKPKRPGRLPAAAESRDEGGAQSRMMAPPSTCKH